MEIKNSWMGHTTIKRGDVGWQNGYAFRKKPYLCEVERGKMATKGMIGKEVEPLMIGQIQGTASMHSTVLIELPV